MQFFLIALAALVTSSSPVPNNNSWIQNITNFTIIYNYMDYTIQGCTVISSYPFPSPFILSIIAR